jgi:hypothetical protein
MGIIIPPPIVTPPPSGWSCPYAAMDNMPTVTITFSGIVCIYPAIVDKWNGTFTLQPIGGCWWRMVRVIDPTHNYTISLVRWQWQWVLSSQWDPWACYDNISNVPYQTGANQSVGIFNGGSHSFSVGFGIL